MALKLAERPTEAPDQSDHGGDFAKWENEMHQPDFDQWERELGKPDYSTPRDMSQSGDNRDGLGTKPAGVPDFRPAAVAKALHAAEAGAGGASPLAKDTAAAERGGYYDQSMNDRFAKLSKHATAGGFMQRHRKGIMGVLVTLILGGGGFGLFTIISGPAQLIQAMNFIKDVKLFISDMQTGARMLHNLPSLQALLDTKSGTSISGRVRNSRLGVVGNKVADRMMNRMAKQGVSFDSGILGSDRGMTIDRSKLSGMDLSGDKDAVAKKLGIDPKNIESIDGDKIKVSEKLSRRETSRVVSKLDNVGKFNVVGQIQKRLVLTKIGKLSMFHFIDKAKMKAIKKLEDFIADAAKKVTTGVSTPEEAKRKAESNEKAKIEARGESPDTEANKKAISEVGEKAAKSFADVVEKISNSAVKRVVSSLASNLTKSAVPGVGIIMAIIQVACMVKDMQEGAGAYKQFNVVNVAEGATSLVMGTGSQIMSGEDIDMDAVGYTTQMAMGAEIDEVDQDGNPTGNKTYKSFWNSLPVCRELGELCGNMVEVPEVLTGVAKGGLNFFSDTINNILSGVLDVPGVGFVCWVNDLISSVTDFLMSKVMGFIMGILPDSLTEWMNNIMASITGFMYGAPLNMASLNPTGWGAVAMYGGKFLSNEQMRATGGTVLSDTQSQVLYNDQRDFLAWQQSQKPLLARLFDPTDYNSTINQIARAANLNTSDQSFTTQFANVFKFFGSVPQLFASALGKIGGATAFAEAEPYDYGVPDYAFTPEEMDKINSDSSFEILQNMAIVLGTKNDGSDGLLKQKPNLINKANECYGVTLTPEGDITQESQKTQESLSWNYADDTEKDKSGCGGDDLLHIRTYIMDYNLTRASACYEGDNSDADVSAACGYVGMSDGSASGASDVVGAPGTLTGPCPANTNDLGIYDQAHDGNPDKPVSVRLCELTSINGKPKGSHDPEIFNASGAIVSAQYADAFQKMGEAAKADGMQLTGKGIRSYEQQVYFWGCYQSGDCNNGNLAARPGTSNHEIGNAIDFDTGGGTLQWLRNHGKEYGFQELSTEDWHWSPGG